MFEISQIMSKIIDEILKVIFPGKYLVNIIIAKKCRKTKDLFPGK